MDQEIKKLIFGRNDLENIVSCEVTDEYVELFIENKDKITSTFKPNNYWILCSELPKGRLGWDRLKGNLHYKWINKYEEYSEFLKQRSVLKNSGYDIFSIYDKKEASMLLNGFTYYKGMKVNDVSVLSFDIESLGLEHNNKSKVLLISNTYRKSGEIIRKLFSYEDYSTDAGLFDAWCDWVRKINPSIIIGHNIFSYDFPYLDFCAKKSGTSLKLGRDGSDIWFNKFDSKFRKDGSQDYSYNRCFIYGREIVDTMFLSIHYDVGRKYDSYGLKQIIKHEGLEIQGRQFYDASKISENYLIPEEWIKIKEYAKFDADDSLALYDLMIPSYFYFTQSTPKSFQSINYSATGSPINAILVRSYLQNYHSIPKQSEAFRFEGAISFGEPGIYKNLFKLDANSLYPSIMLQYEVFDKYKDSNKNFYKMLDYFTKERLENKRKAKETNDRYFKDLEQSQKIVVNSAYGLLGSSGLNFNSPINASIVTKKGREILEQSIEWARNKNFIVANADTDSISICKNDHSTISEQERKDLLYELNSLMPEKIIFDDDGYFSKVLILKAKNYVLVDEQGKKKIKGSALKSSKTEKAIKEFMEEIINCLLENNKIEIVNVYNKYIKECFNLKDISRWTKKVTITDKVLDPKRTNEQKILDAVQGQDIQMGNKVWLYFDKESNLKRQDQWNNDHSEMHLIKKLYKTLQIFDSVINIEDYIKYELKRNKLHLEELLNASL